MAPKRLPEDPPAASSMEEDSDAETIDDEEEEQNDVVRSDDDSETDEKEDEEVAEEEENAKKKKPVVIPNPQSDSDSSSSDDGGDSETETESDDINHSPSASDFTVKPIVSKPMAADSTSSAKPDKKTTAASGSAAKPIVSKPIDADSTSSAKPDKKTTAASGSAPPKRAAVESDLNPKDSKKKKGGGGGEDEDSKKGRLWSEDDEAAILKGMIDFKAKRGVDAMGQMSAFHAFVDETLKAEVKTTQLMDKVRRLKKKYQTVVENGEESVLSKPHEAKLFQLSKKIWGVEANGGEDSAKSSKKKARRGSVAAANDNSSNTVLALPVSDVAEERKVEKKNVMEKKAEVIVANGRVKADGVDEFWAKYPALRNSLRFGYCSPFWEEGVMMQKLHLIGSAKANELNDKWKKLQDAEMELSVKKLELMHEQTKVAMEAATNV